jgi:hypothetical protein
MHRKSFVRLNYRHGLPAGLNLKTEKDPLWPRTDGRSFFFWMKPLHLPQGTGPAVNVAEPISTDLNPFG